MAYEIRIRGHREAIIVEKNAEKLRSDWEAYQINRIDKVVEVENWVGRLSLIQDFQRVRSAEADKQSNADIIHKEYMADRDKILGLTIEERASHMGFFRLVYWGFTGRRSEDIMVGDKPIEEFAKNIQRKFFTENPKRLHCDPTAFRPIIKSEKCNEKLMANLETIVRQDSFAAAKF